MTKYFGTDGIRLHAEDLTADFLAGVITGLIAYHGSPDFSLLIGGDTRASTATILQNLEQICAARGIRCINIAVFPTPAINFYLKDSGLDFAIDVTASHNPATYNGLKIFEYTNGESIKLSESGRVEIESALTALTPATLASPASEDQQSAALDAYLAHLRDYVGACNFSGQKIAIDCANGATSIISGRLFTEFGADVTIMNSDVNFGTKINDNCGSTHLAPLQKTVVDNKLDFGLAFDGDGDRCLLVDNTGDIVDGDKILALLADYLELKSLVTTVMAGQGLFVWASAHGITLEITDVGDQNVYARMVEKGIKLGGEQSGHIILPFEPMGDGMLTALMMAKVISERRLPLATLAAEIPTLPQFMYNLPATSAQKSQLSGANATAVITKYQQFLGQNNGRLLVRPSGTEDLIRITLWGDESLNLTALAESLAKELQEAL